jgi:GDP-D-mannose 3',5'-epimerase
MKILILGSTGFIGSNLLQKIQDKNNSSSNCTIRTADIRPEIYSINKDFKLGDLRDLNFCKDVFNIDGGFDEVYQLAADVGGSNYINSTYNGSIMINNVAINTNCLLCAKEYKAKKIFFASSACIYSNKDNVAFCKEEDAYPSLPDNEYGWEKLLAEHMYINFGKQFNIDIRIARFHSIIGENCVYKGIRCLASGEIIHKVIQSQGEVEIFGTGLESRNFLYVGDCVEAVLLLMNSNCTDVLNIGSERNVTINEYIEITKTISKKEFILKPSHCQLGVKTRYCSLEKIKQKLGWRPSTSLEDAIRKTYIWISLNEKNH